MLKQQLSANRWLLVEPADKKLRLVITNGEHELACRKETPGKLRRFLASTETDLFKGRLQLRKQKGAVVLVLKGEDVGVVGLNDLAEVL